MYAGVCPTEKQQKNNIKSNSKTNKATIEKQYKDNAKSVIKTI